jgi:predicted nucleic acid-binding protein
MGILIDASVLIEAERGRLRLSELAARHGDEDAAISVISVSELLHGVHRLTGARAAKAETFVEGLISVLPILPFDMPEARVHARLSADLHARGTRIGPHDLLIAATALANDYRIATRDRRSFPKIEGLELVNV